MQKLTIKKLLEACAKEVAAGNGDREILVPADEEGNGYHGLYETFTKVEEFYHGRPDEDWSCGYISECFEKGKDSKDYVILG